MFKAKKFSNLLEQYLSSLLRFAYSRCNDKHLAEDLVQETCMKAYKAFIVQENEIYKFKEWIFTILINTHISYLRKRKLELLSDKELDEFEINEAQSMTLNQIEIKEDINHALSFLNKEQREVIYLVDVEEYSFNEASKILGIPFGTLASRLQRGRTKLRLLLSNMGYGYKKAKTGDLREVQRC